MCCLLYIIFFSKIIIRNKWQILLWYRCWITLLLLNIRLHWIYFLKNCTYINKQKKKVTRYHFVIIFINNYYSCNVDVVLNDATHLPFPKISFRSNIRETRWITRYILGIQWFIAKSIRKRWCFLCRWYITAETADEGRPRNQRTIFFFFSFSTLITIFFRVPISQSCGTYARCV